MAINRYYFLIIAIGTIIAIVAIGNGTTVGTIVAIGIQNDPLTLSSDREKGIVIEWFRLH